MGPEIAFPVEFALPAVPVSLQASGRSRQSWKERLRACAVARLPEGHWASEDRIAVTILYFPASTMAGDIDNIVKPVLDAMTGLIYLDDGQVDRVLVQKFEAGVPVSVVNPSADLAIAMALMPPMFYVRIDDVGSREAAP